MAAGWILNSVLMGLQAVKQTYKERDYNNSFEVAEVVTSMSTDFLPVFNPLQPIVAFHKENKSLYLQGK